MRPYRPHWCHPPPSAPTDAVTPPEALRVKQPHHTIIRGRQEAVAVGARPRAVHQLHRVGDGILVVRKEAVVQEAAACKVLDDQLAAKARSDQQAAADSKRRQLRP